MKKVSVIIPMYNSESVTQSSVTVKGKCYYESSRQMDSGLYIYNAEYVVSNSFRAVAFGIIYEMRFLVFGTETWGG